MTCWVGGELSVTLKFAAVVPALPSFSATLSMEISGWPSSREPVRAAMMYVPASPALVMNRVRPSSTYGMAARK